MLNAQLPTYAAAAVYTYAISMAAAGGVSS